ncbi:MAG: EF-hand domain-containing protein [Gammaproteobacteria bacterium]|nr:EF-hand domain-containing protein [Gammaproteobacteria bacterium]
MTKKPYPLIVLALSAVILSQTTTAAPPERRGAMAHFDTDGNGVASASEIAAKRIELFAQADGDNDGTLSVEEYEVQWQRAHRRAMVRAFQRADTDGDGRVTNQEFSVATQQLQRRAAHRQQRRRGGERRTSFRDFREARPSEPASTW